MKYISTKYAALGILLLAVSLASGQDKNSGNRRTITVSGKAEHSLPADRVVVSAEIRVEKQKLSDAREQSEASLKQLIIRLGTLGIKPAKIELTNHSLGKNYETIDRQRKQIGFYSEREFLIDLDDVSLLEAVHQELAEDPVIKTERTNFYRKDEIEVRNKARREALEAAKEKASTMSSVYGQKIGKVIEIKENGGGFPFGSNIFNTRNTGAMTNGNTATGRVSVSAQVTVVFELVD